MAWGSISLFAGFLEKENSLETLIVIFENVSPKGFFWLNMKDFEISVLKANSRYLQTAALNCDRKNKHIAAPTSRADENETTKNLSERTQRDY